MNKPKRQAVVVIHGMGQQRPMEFMRSLARALWAKDLSLTEHRAQQDWDSVRKREVIGGIGPGDEINQSWLVPDGRTGSRELARLTTPKADNDTRTDFFELYYADVMEGTTSEHLGSWFRGLLFRWPTQVPARVVAAWLWLWGLTMFSLVMGAIAGFAIVMSLLGNPMDPVPWLHIDGDAFRATALLAGAAVGYFKHRKFIASAGTRPKRWQEALVFLVWPLGFVAFAHIFPLELLTFGQFYALLLSAVVVWLFRRALVPTFGDVARYVRATPSSVANRAEILERGLSLLRRLHGHHQGPDDPFIINPEADQSAPPPYDRIIVVAHSLGSVVAYDLLRHFWAERVSGLDISASPALAGAVSRMEAHLNEADGKVDDLEDWQDRQRALCDALQANGTAWRITDFVTLGSPLSHADFLMERDGVELLRAKEEGRLVMCPPQRPTDGNDWLSFKNSDGDLSLRHSAAFAPVVWTNIHDQPRHIVLGDIVSGPVGPCFGTGIADIQVRIRRIGTNKGGGWWSQLVTHTLYWDEQASADLVDSPYKEDRDLGVSGSQDHITLLRRAVDLGRARRSPKTGDGTTVV